MNETTSEACAETDQARLKYMGRQVREGLASHPQIYRLPSEEIELFALGDFLSPAECARLITMIDDVAQPSALYDTAYASGFRTSFSGNIDPRDPLVCEISERIDALLGMEAAWGESIQGQRYLPGQQFQPHHDFFHPGTSYWDTEMARGGQRSFTAMVFLNAVEAGGHTDFTELKIALEPRPGVLLMWNNARPDGTPNHKTIHAGKPVEAGAKYIITKWYRTRPWG